MKIGVLVFLLSDFNEVVAFWEKHHAGLGEQNTVIALF
jgi:hypothetical protein